MIIDRLTNADLYSSLGPRIKRAFEYIQQTDLTALAAGKYELDGENLFVIVQEYTTKPKVQGKWEAHRRYIDIQYVIRGTERIGYVKVDRLTPTGAHDAEKDIRFFSGEGDFLTLPEGTFMLLLPEDAHMPGIAVDAPRPVKKAVIKISVT